MNKLSACLIALTAVLAVSCKKDNLKDTVTPTPVTPVDKVAPDGFTFKTSKDISIDIALRANNDEPLAGVKVNIYDPANTARTAAIFTGLTDKAGKLTTTISVASALTQLVIDPEYAGVIRYAVAAINGSATHVVLGGKAGFSGDVLPAAIASASLSTASLKTFATTIKFAYPSPYTTTSEAVVNNSTYALKLGRPKYLLQTGDVIDASLLKNVNASLPESAPLTTTHPEYLESKVTSTLNITQQADVWITYVSEGAGNLNTLAYYTYTTGNAPKLVTDITNATYVFPNASGYGSGGGLQSGDKVLLGRFDKGTSIGFILIGSGWNGSGINTDNIKFYSDDALNPEKDTRLKKHSIVLFDDLHKLFLIGFEDLNREGSSDNDFNDLVFYATSNPVAGISQDGVPAVDTNGDTDGDGVLDAADAFPNDASKAYITYFPSASTYAQVAFEDNWPNKGDYDMNDLVVNYRYTFIKNAKNQVVSLTGDYTATAAGASFKNGFGVQLPVSASLVKSVSGQKAISNYVSFAANGVEAGQSKAVIIPFDNHDAVLKNTDGSYFINTLNSKDKVTGSTVSVAITFTAPVDEASLIPSAFNPFLISNLRRGYEVHLPGFAPTDLADTRLFKTNDDTSVPASGRYYQAADNGPWAIAYNSAILWPLENVNINTAYLHFTEWAKSGGASYTDWYSNIGSGYRDVSGLYTK